MGTLQLERQLEIYKFVRSCSIIANKKVYVPQGNSVIFSCICDK